MQETELLKKIKKREMIQLILDEELAQKLYAEELAKETGRQEQEKCNMEKVLELQRQLDKREKDAEKNRPFSKAEVRKNMVTYLKNQEGYKQSYFNGMTYEDIRPIYERNRPFSKAEVRKNMVMYLKNQEGYKQSYFNGMKYEDIRPIYERVWDQLHTFVPKDSEIKKQVIKRCGFHLQQERLKKKKEMKLYMRIVPDEDIAIDVIPLATKPSVIIEYNIVKEGKIGTYHFRRADGSTKRYTSMINLLENINREDLEAL
nr:hypothetical protein [Tanacetum cinerariifolium]